MSSSLHPSTARLVSLRFGVAAVSGVAAALVLAMAGVVAAGPARAAANSVTFTSPGGSAPLTTATPAVAGRAQVAGCISSIDVAVGPLDGQPDPIARTTFTGNGKGTEDFAWPDATRPALVYNGRYKATATVYFRPTGPLGCTGQQDTFVTVDQPFSLAVAPAAPGNVQTAVNSTARQVTVSWDTNKEPDLIGYSVSRAPAPGGGVCPAAAPSTVTAVATAKPPATDTFADGDPGGQYCYWAQAVRKGATADQAVTSAYSKPAVVPVAPPPVAASPAAGSATGVPARDPVTAPAPPLPAGGTTDSHDFTALVDKAKRPATKPGSSEDPDTGFKQTLPFQAPRDTEDDGGDATVADTAAIGTSQVREAGASDRVGQLGAMAGGLILLVLGGHLLLLRRAVVDAPAGPGADVLEPLEPSDALAG